MNKVTLLILGIVLSATSPAFAQEISGQAPAAQTSADAQAPVEVGNKICPVSGEKIKKTDMGEPVKIEHNGKMYGLCCPMCIKDFKKDPDKYAAIADKEVADAAVTP